MLETTSIEFTHLALELRGAVNIAIFVFCGVLAFLFGRYAYKELHTKGYRHMEWQAKGAVGLSIMCLGEMARSGTIWEILRFKGVRGTYLTDILPLLVALILITVGAACAIRVFSPTRWGHKPWILSVIAVVILVGINWAWL